MQDGGASEEFQAKQGSEPLEFDDPKVFGQQICGIIITVNEVDFGKLPSNYFTYIVISDIDMLGALFSDRIRGDENQSLIIPADWDRL